PAGIAYPLISVAPPSSPSFRIPLLPHSFSFNDPAPPEIYTLSLHDALPISSHLLMVGAGALAPHLIRAHARARPITRVTLWNRRSEEHTSELQSLTNLVCRLLLEKKKKRRKTKTDDHNATISVRLRIITTAH